MSFFTGFSFVVKDKKYIFAEYFAFIRKKR